MGENYWEDITEVPYRLRTIIIYVYNKKIYLSSYIDQYNSLFKEIYEHLKQLNECLCYTKTEPYLEKISVEN